MSKKAEPIPETVPDEIQDPFAKWRDEPGCMEFDVPVPEDCVFEVAKRWDGRTYPTFRIVKALAQLGGVAVLFFTEDQLTRQNYPAMRRSGTWPMDLIAQAYATVNAIRDEREEQAEVKRKEKNWAEQQAQREAEAAKWRGDT